MSYLSVITLDQAKLHLRIDKDFCLDDHSIERMVSSALELIENNTNHMVYPRDKTYYRNYERERVVVFDYPINDIPNTNVDVTRLSYSLRTEYCIDTITLNVGYEEPGSVPNPLIDAALMLIEDWYFESETEGRKTLMSDQVQQILFNYKRCIVS